MNLSTGRMLLLHPWSSECHARSGVGTGFLPPDATQNYMHPFWTYICRCEGKHLYKQPQYLPQSCCVWWGWVGRPCAGGSPGSSPAGCRRTPRSRRRPAGNPTPEQEIKKTLIGETFRMYRHICSYISVDSSGNLTAFWGFVSAFSYVKKGNSTLKTGQSLCEVSPSWRSRGRTSEFVHGHGSRDGGSRKGPATTDRYKEPTPALCSGNTESGLGWLCTTYGSSPATDRTLESRKYRLILRILKSQQ